MSPALEIIVPLRNPGAELARTVASLTSQTDRGFGVLLCDNFSTTGLECLDKAQKLLASDGIPVRCLRPPFELRHVEHWNWAHAESRAEWLKPLSPGGALKPAYVQQLKQRVSQQPKAQLVRCEFEIDSAGKDSRDDAPFPSAQPS